MYSLLLMVSSISVAWSPGLVSAAAVPPKANYSIISVPIPGLFNPTNPPSGFIPDVLKKMSELAGFNYHFANLNEKGFGRPTGSNGTTFDGAMGAFIQNKDKYHIYASMLENEGPYSKVVEFLTPLFLSNVTTVYNLKRALPDDVVQRTVGFLNTIPVIGAKLAQNVEKLDAWFQRTFGDIFRVVAGVFGIVKPDPKKVATETFWKNMETAVLDFSQTYDEVTSVLRDPSKLKDQDTMRSITSTMLNPQGLIPKSYDEGMNCVKRDTGNACRFIGRTPVIDNEIFNSAGKLGKDTKIVRSVWGSFAVHKDFLKNTVDPKVVTMVKSLNTAIRKMIETGAVERIYMQYFKHSVYTRPTAASPYWKSKLEG